MRLRRAGTEEVRAVVGNAVGQLEILVNDEVTER